MNEYLKKVRLIKSAVETGILSQDEADKKLSVLPKEDSTWKVVSMPASAKQQMLEGLPDDVPQWRHIQLAVIAYKILLREGKLQEVLDKRIQSI